jgi:ribosomal protein S18 acetylase RimI-like enzyme
MQEMFRLGTTDELGLIKSIAFRAYFPYVEMIGKRPAPLDANYFEKIEDRALHILLVNNEIVGFIVVYFVDGNLLIENVAVDPIHHGKGFGSKLMRYAENLAARGKAEAITLYTQEHMIKNIQIYTGMGYVFTHKSEWNGLNRIHMSKTL